MMSSPSASSGWRSSCRCWCTSRRCLTSPPLMRSLAFDPSDHVEKSQALIAQLAPRASAAGSLAAATPPSPPSRAAPAPAPAPPRPAPPPPPADPARPTRPQCPTSRSRSRARATPAAHANPRGRPRRPICPRTLPRGAARVAKPRDVRIQRAERSASGKREGAAQPHRRRQSRLEQDATFGDDPKRGGGMFQIRRIGYDDAEFYFNGWNQDIGRVARQLIEVRKGTNPDIRIAVVRKIIEIIRAHDPAISSGCRAAGAAGHVVGASGRQRRTRGLHDARVLRRRSAPALGRLASAPRPRRFAGRKSCGDPRRGPPSTARR